MKTSNIRLVILAAAATALASISNLHAQATRTWVSGVGDDANPGSRTAPCKTFAGAISKTAAGGEISVLDPGGFGAVTITKSMTLNGDGTIGSILAFGTNGIVINAGTTDVIVIRNISFKSPGGGIASPSGFFGIKVLQAGEVHVENCVIQDGTDVGISFQPINTNAKLFVTNTTILNCAGGGIQVIPGMTGSANASITNVRFQGCKYGVRAEQGSKVTIDHSVITASVGTGVVAAGNGELDLIDSIVSYGAFAGVNSGGGGSLAIVRLSNCSILHNGGKGVVNNGSSQIISLGNNVILGNNPDGAPTSTVMPQ